VLGVHIGLLAGHAFGIPLPQSEKRLLAIAETNGCFVDGLSAATGCYFGRRTLRIEDYGKTAATFVETTTEQAYMDWVRRYSMSAKLVCPRITRTESSAFIFPLF
jgi:formylmethanofuran dehydrogenase subunit E